MTTTLEAVNEILEAIGEPPVSALDTGGTSEEAEAETYLDRASERIQRMGWFANTIEDVELTFASVKLTGTISAGTFTKGELVTQASSGAQGYIVDAYTVGDTTYYICPLADSASFTTIFNITGSVSGTSTASVGGASNSEASGPIILPYGTLRVRPRAGAGAKITVRNDRLYDLEDNTATFDESHDVDLTMQLTFSDLPEPLATYITKVAAIDFSRYKKRGIIDDRMAQQELVAARVRARQDNSDESQFRITQTLEHIRFAGDRRTVYLG